MGEIITFLRRETEKKEHLIEDFLTVRTASTGGFDLQNLRKVLLDTYHLYSCIEKLRESHSHWVMVSDSRLFDLMRALINLDVLPPSPSIVDKYKTIPETAAVGFLYVFHVFQMHTHSLGRLLENEHSLDESIYRAFTFIQNDLMLRGKFLDLIKAKMNKEDSGMMAEGVQLAFSEIEKYLDESAAKL